MKALLIQIDGKIDLANRKWGGYFKERGYEVFYNDGCPNPDLVKISCIFEWNAPKVREVAKTFSCPVEIGGYGVNKAQLPPDVEHHMPDYEGMDYSVGFSTRGCIRNCPWCVVPRMEGHIRDHAPISEFHHPDHNKLVLWDNNLLALDWKFKEDIKYITENGLKVSFNQGLDIRLVNEEFAGMLADCKYYDWKFKNRRLYFAFDFPEIEDEVVKGIEILKGAGIPPGRLMFYMLVGFEANNGYSWGDFIRNDYHRFEFLDGMGVLPYVMTYNDRRDIPLLNPHFERWVDGRYYKICDFGSYDRGNSQEVIKAAMSGGQTQ